MKSTKIQKITNEIRCKQKGSKYPGENSRKHRIRKQQTENGNFDNRKNRYYITTRNGLDENIQTNYR